MDVQCSRCLHPIPDRHRPRLPPWCPKCGLYLTPENVRSQSADADASRQWAADQLRERFSRHNLGVGLLLACWGLFVGLKGQPDNLDKLLNSQAALATVVTILQWGMLANGVLLFVSGLGVRARRPWGMTLAAASAVVSILAGGVFLGVFWHLGTFQGLENSVVRVTFTTTNLDLLVGPVDAVALLVFLHLSRAAETPASQDSAPAGSRRAARPG